MQLTAEERKVLLSALEIYRLWSRLQLASSNDDLDDGVEEYFEQTIQTLAAIKQKVAIAHKASKEESASDKDGAEETPTSPEVAEAAADSEGKNKVEDIRILIAEDNKESAELLEVLLEDLGAEKIDVAFDGAAAIAKLESASEPYDLILCDWNMPEHTGLEVHAKAKEGDLLKGAKFILVTAVTDDVLKSRALRQGMDDFIAKPLDAEVLEAKVKDLLNL